MHNIFKIILIFLLMFTFWEKTYSVAAGEVKIRIDYDLTYSAYNLNFDVIDMGKLSYGYEDDDQLTFYPNTMKLSFDDSEKKYYDVLKLSLGEYQNSYPENFLKYGGVTLWLNGQVKFKGYIDQLTLQYDNDNRTTEFECIDVTRALRDMSVENVFGNDNYHNLPYLIYKIYKKVYPDLSDFIYSDQNFENGIYFKHDWRFEGRRTLSDIIIRDWSNNADVVQTYFNFSSTGIFGDSRPADTYADLIKLMALQFGMVIGSVDYNKIYMVKRFSLINNNFINLDAKLINSYKRYLHLPALVGARNKNTWNGTRIYTAGFVETVNSQGDLKYKNLVKEFDTSIGSYGNQSEGGTAIITAAGYNVFNGVRDPSLVFDGHIGETICQWVHRTRIRPKDKIECELYGIDYNMSSFYEITSPGNPTLRFRPMTIEVDLLNDMSQMTGIEA